MKQSIIWTKQQSLYSLSMTEKVGVYRGVVVEKTKHFYYINWSTNVGWAAPHAKMSDGIRSAVSAKKMIDRLLELESQDMTVIVRRFDSDENKALWSARGCNSPIGAAGSRREKAV